MQITLAKLFLKSTDVNRTSRFLSFLFECEFFQDEDDKTYTFLGGIKIVLAPIETQNIVLSEHYFSFHVAQKDLENIQKKIEFFCYRETMDPLVMTLTQDSFSFVDFDGNYWNFEQNRQMNSVNVSLM